MEKLKVYVHSEHSRDLKVIEILETASIKDIIDQFHKEFPVAGNPEEIELFLEGEEEPKHKEHKAEHAGVKKKHHIHCHRCKKIEVLIMYNGQDKIFQLSPAATANVVLEKAIHAFNINPEDAGDYLLKLEDKTVLQPNDHIGSFATYPVCKVKLYLTPTKPVQG